MVESEPNLYNLRFGSQWKSEAGNALGAGGAQTHISLGHHLLHPQLLRLLVLFSETCRFWGQELSSMEQTAPTDWNF